MKYSLISIFAAALLFFTGCETVHTFSINSINHPAPIGDYKTFAIAAGPEIQDADSLQFLEASKFAKTALISEGYRESESPEDADLIIELGFGISDPQTTIKERTEPVYAYTGGGYRKRLVQVYDRNGNAHTKVVYSYYPSRHRMIGWNNRLTANTVYEKSITMRAYSADPESPDGQSKEIWMVEVRNQNGSEDLRYYIPRMLAASLDYIDYDSEDLKKVRLSESDPRIQMILAPSYL